MQRRTVLAWIGAATLPLAGCLEDGPGGTDETPDLPAECPKTQDLDVDWPEDLDRQAAESFVEEYEHHYYREVVVEYEPESRVDSYELSTWVGDATASGDGYEMKVSGGGGIYTPTLRLTAKTAEPPDGAEVVPASEIDDHGLDSMLRDAAESGDADLHIERPGAEVERYIELLESVSEAFDPPSSPGDEGSLYVDVDGATVELTAQATRFHGDYGWWAWYYVDEHVVRRTDEEGIDPRDGKLLECRTSD